MLLSLPEEIWLQVFEYLDFPTLWMLILLSPIWAQYIGNSSKLMLMHQLELTTSKCEILTTRGDLSNIPFRNISAKSCKDYSQLRKILKVIRKIKDSIEILELEDFKRNQIKEILDFFKGFSSLRILKIKNCLINEEVTHQHLTLLPTLKEIYFEKCCKNFFKIFHGQEGITKISVRNTDWTWNGFAHDDFNDLMKTLPKIDTMVLNGAGTGSYFDCDYFPYKIRKLVTSMITFHWYVGIRTERKTFLESQKNFLKELVIDQLPYDFDGGRVLKFIIEQMDLDCFYYGNIPLLCDRQIQPVLEFSANEIQLCAMYEMFRQFPTIKRLRLNLSQTDVDSNEIERVLNPRTNLFNNVDDFEVFDKSGYRKILGLFLGLFKNLRNIKRIKIQSSDNNINVLLQEFLPVMTNLKEISLNSKAPRETDRLNIIRNNVPGLTKLWVAAEYVQEAKNIFGIGVEVNET